MAGLRHCAEQGFSLIEVLIALLIVMTAVFSTMLLLFSAVQHSRDAVLQVRALHYVEDMFERIRANPQASYQITYGSAPPAPPRCTTDFCDSAQMAAFEVAHWKCLLGGVSSRICTLEAADIDVLTLCADFSLPDRCYALPEGDGQIEKSGQTYSVRVRWVPAYSDTSLKAKRELVVSGDVH